VIVNSGYVTIRNGFGLPIQVPYALYESVLVLAEVRGGSAFWWADLAATMVAGEFVHGRESFRVVVCAVDFLGDETYWRLLGPMVFEPPPATDCFGRASLWHRNRLTERPRHWSFKAKTPIDLMWVVEQGQENVECLISGALSGTSGLYVGGVHPSRRVKR